MEHSVYIYLIVIAVAVAGLLVIALLGFKRYKPVFPIKIGGGQYMPA